MALFLFDGKIARKHVDQTGPWCDQFSTENILTSLIETNILNDNTILNHGFIQVQFAQNNVNSNVGLFFSFKLI